VHTLDHFFFSGLAPHPSSFPTKRLQTESIASQNETFFEKNLLLIFDLQHMVQVSRIVDPNVFCSTTLYPTLGWTFVYSFEEAFGENRVNKIG
jgi:hypothetical protein